MPGRVFSREFKLTVVRQVANGEKRPAQVCREHQQGERLLARWRKEYEERGEAAFASRQEGEPTSPEQRVAELERFCGQLALENYCSVQLGLDTAGMLVSGLPLSISN